ncbi:MAG: PKD domain-containing protein [Flavisolibacter sp.]
METPKETCFIPYVDFVAYHVDPNSLEVSFTSITSYNGTIKSHLWDFGDGTTYEGEQPPPHHYQNSNSSSTTYRIKYTVANDCGKSFWTHDITVSQCLPDVKFSYQSLNDSTIEFTNQTQSSSPASYTWDFGDGTSSSSSAPTVSKTFSQDKNYTVSLKATNGCGDNYYTAQVSICRKAQPAQTVSVSGCGTVTVNASATRNGGKYQWNFGNGVVLPTAPSANSSITYTYPSAGSYTIILSVINAGGCDTATTSTPVTISNNGLTPNNNWGYTSDDLDFNFFRTAVSNATSYTWNFGDFTTSNAQNPGNKTYANPGVYTVSLGASNGCSNYNFTSIITAPFYQTMRNLPNTGFSQVAVNSVSLIYFLGTNGKLYRTDTTGNWSGAINLPSSLVFNSDTRLFQDQNKNLWIYGRNEVARFNTSSNSWTSFYSTTGLAGNTTINAIAIDNNGSLWVLGDRQVRRNNTVINAGNAQFSSLAFASSTNRMWITASNKTTLYYVNSGSNQVNTINLSSVQGGLDDIRVHPDGDLYFSTPAGMGRASSSGNLLNVYTSSNTNGLLTGPPSNFDFDSRGNLWVVQSGRLLKIPAANSTNAKNYSFTSDLSAVAWVGVLQISNTDNDIYLAKTSANAAVRIK